MPAPDRRGTLAVEVTHSCNRSCLYCYNPPRTAGFQPAARTAGIPAGSPTPPGTAGIPAGSPTQLADLVEQALSQSNLRNVQITGGEPLLYPGLFDFIEALRAPDRRISLVTDGALLTDSAIAQLKALTVGPIQPTLLSADRALHNKLKGADCFDATIAAITRLLSAGVPTSVSFVATALNYNHFKQVIELCFALGVRVIALSRFCSVGTGLLNADALQLSASMLTHCLDVAHRANTSLGLKVQIAISLPLCITDPDRTPSLQFGRCAICTDTPGFTMDAQGNLRACSISPTILGNLNDSSWSEILASAQSTYFTPMSTPPPHCVPCPLLPRCGGGCRESALAFYNDLSHPDPLVSSQS